MTATLTITDPELLSFAEAVGSEGPVAVEGARTRWDRGGALDPATRLVSAPTGIVTYQPAEMIVQVRVGTTVAELHDELAEAGQRTALPDRGGTIGGALAVGEDDVCVLGVGRVRTAALQVRYVSSEGRLVTGGGPTVKNVTGFDLPRLMVGSLGTLGLFAEAILRTNPIPDVSVWLEAEDADPFAARDALFRPSAVLWDGTRTWVQLEGHAPDVAAQRRALATAGTFAEAAGPPELPRHRRSLRRSQLRELGASALDGGVASVGTGTIFVHAPVAAPAVDPAVAVVTDRLKAEFDPARRLAPGRDPAVN